MSKSGSNSDRRGKRILVDIIDWIQEAIDWCFDVLSAAIAALGFVLKNFLLGPGILAFSFVAFIYCLAISLDNFYTHPSGLALAPNPFTTWVGIKAYLTKSFYDSELFFHFLLMLGMNASQVVLTGINSNPDASGMKKAIRGFLRLFGYFLYGVEIAMAFGVRPIFGEGIGGWTVLGLLLFNPLSAFAPGIGLNIFKLGYGYFKKFVGSGNR
ncbi:hypothetical protein [Moorena sp. SIO3I8]|uniref:hypothetical protein n=1 Tax=Moorena sp. SIO3I8 TaxID=2607833 RepID=UPI0013C0838C|nr:hypothetical protein [Moorena sp. SIO3I8]NEO08751.1 hypothetical protein [Moorena sp. SIO3I8]